MNLNQLNFTRRRFRSDLVIYNDFSFALNTGNNVNGGVYELLKYDGDTFVLNPSSGIIDFSTLPKSTEVTFITYEYPDPGNNVLIAYGVNINANNDPCFTSPLKKSRSLSEQNINKGGPGSRLGITLQRSRHNIWAFGGYPGAGGTNSTPDSYFFLFNGTSDSWVDKTDLAVKANIPNLVYHTMTNINDEYLLVIGGGTYNNQGILVDKPFDKAYKFDLNKETWSTTSLINCPTNTKIGHTTTIVNENLIVTGGTDNQEESKLNIYSGILSIDPTTSKCIDINLSYENRTSANIKRAFHAAIYIDKYLGIASGMQESDYENQLILVDTSTWTRISKIEDLKYSSNPESQTSKTRQTFDTVIYSIIGIVLFLVIATLLCYFFVFRRRKRRELCNTQLLANQTNNQEPVIEWVKSDSKIIRLDNEGVFSFEDKFVARKNIEADREADLRQLNSISSIYINNIHSKENSVYNNIQEFSGTLTNETLINSRTPNECNTLSLSYLSKDNA